MSSLDRVESEIMIRLAGPIAEGLCARRRPRWTTNPHNSTDFDHARIYAGLAAENNRLVTGLTRWRRFYIPARREEEILSHVAWLALRAEGLLTRDENWTAVQAVAADLLKSRRIGYRRARQIIAGALAKPAGGEEWAGRRT
jgi:hypothetical protein